MKHLVLMVNIIVAATILAPGTLHAYPGFGKKVDPSLRNSCSRCHVVFPKLRLYGRTTREIGYKVPTMDFPEPILMEMYRKLPLAVRGKVDIIDTELAGGARINELQLLSSGNVFGDKVSWWFHKHILEGNEFVPLSEGTPHEVWLQYNQSDKLHLRAGMFELPMWYSWSKTKISELGYLYYGTTTNEDDFGVIAAPQFGIQANGTFSLGSNDEDDWGDEDDSMLEGYNYAVSITNGETSFQGTANTFFGRITRKQPGYALGLFSMAARYEANADTDHAHGTPDAAPEKAWIFRLGLDAQKYLRGDNLTLNGSIVYGQDAERNFIGGFGGYEQLLYEKLFIFGRLDAVFFTSAAPPDEHDDMDMDMDDEDAHGAHGAIITDDAYAACFGMAYMFWGNVRLTGEYRYGFSGIDSKGLVQLQFAF